MFTIQGLQFRYPKAEALTLDLAEFDLVLPPGGTIALLGESGSGKSTLLALLGLLWDRPPEAGTVAYTAEGAATSELLAGPGVRLSARRKAELRLGEFGFVPQSSYLLPHLNAVTNVAIPLNWLGLPRHQCHKHVSKLLEAARLGRKEARRKARDLSGGERQRVAVLRAIAHDPRVVFADEPISNLDHANAQAVMNLLRDRWMSGALAIGKRRRDRTLILVSHTVRHTRQYADFLLILYQKRLVSGPGGPLYPADAVTDADLDRAIEFGIPPGAAEPA